MCTANTEKQFKTLLNPESDKLMNDSSSDINIGITFFADKIFPPQLDEMTTEGFGRIISVTFSVTLLKMLIVFTS